MLLREQVWSSFRQLLCMLMCLCAWRGRAWFRICCWTDRSLITHPPDVLHHVTQAWSLHFCMSRMSMTVMVTACWSEELYQVQYSSCGSHGSPSDQGHPGSSISFLNFIQNVHLSMITFLHSQYLRIYSHWNNSFILLWEGNTLPRNRDLSCTQCQDSCLFDSLFLESSVSSSFVSMVLFPFTD